MYRKKKGFENEEGVCVEIGGMEGRLCISALTSLNDCEACDALRG